MTCEICNDTNPSMVTIDTKTICGPCSMKIQGDSRMWCGLYNIYDSKKDIWMHGNGAIVIIEEYQ